MFLLTARLFKPVTTYNCCIERTMTSYCTRRIQMATLKLAHQQYLRPITTSPKQKDATSVPLETPGKENESSKKEDEEYTTVKWREDGRWVTSKNPKDWISYGYHPFDAVEDRWTHRTLMFSFISLGMFLFVIIYFRPDTVHERNWTVREAYLELARREKYGLPLIDPDYIPAEKMWKQLPPDEDVVDEDIII